MNTAKEKLEIKRLRWVWAEMIQRCTNNNNPAFKNYGGRGITVCDRWREFQNFIDDMGPRPSGGTLDRINNDKGYSPDNCRWVPVQVQACNKRLYSANHFGISGVEPRDGKYRVRLRHRGMMVINKTVNDFFEACCIRKSAEDKYMNPVLSGV